MRLETNQASVLARDHATAAKRAIGGAIVLTQLERGFALVIPGSILMGAGLGRWWPLCVPAAVLYALAAYLTGKQMRRVRAFKREHQALTRAE